MTTRTIINQVTNKTTPMQNHFNDCINNGRECAKSCEMGIQLAQEVQKLPHDMHNIIRCKWNYIIIVDKQLYL